MKKKLIEVAVPLGAISREPAREKPMRHGQSSILHRRRARRLSGLPVAVAVSLRNGV